MSQAAEIVTFQVGEARVTLPAQSVVKAWLAGLTEKTPAPASTPLPTIIRPDLAAGERYAGVLLGKDGAPSHHLILLPSDADEVTWEAAKAWAATAGGELPTRREQALLYANLPEEFERAWYWSCEQHEADSYYAWFQYFGNGSQTYDREGNAYRARAVRRLPIE